MKVEQEKLEVGGPIQIWTVDGIIAGTVTSISRGKKGVQVSIRTESGSVTKHIPNHFLQKLGFA